jgi:hypothetical protein
MKKKYRAKLQQLLLMLGCLLTGDRRPTWRAAASSYRCRKPRMALLSCQGLAVWTWLALLSSRGPRVQRRSSGEIISDEDDVSSQAPAAPPNAGVPADRRQETDVETGGEQLALPQASDGAAVVLRVERRSSGREILSDEEEGSSQATAAPPTADRRQETAVESDGGLSSSANLRAATSEHNWFAILCALPHPTCAKWLYAVIFVAGIVLAMNSRDTEVSAFSDQERVHGCEHDRYCLSAESALRVSLAFFVSARNISIILLASTPY